MHPHSSPPGQTLISTQHYHQRISRNIFKIGVIEGYTVSDHNAIKFEICPKPRKINRQNICTARYNIKKANWNLFSCALKTYFDLQTNSDLENIDPDSANQRFTLLK